MAAPISIIVIGCIVLVISFFGCCGAIKESTCMLTTYAVILLILLIAQIAVGIYAFIQVKEGNLEKKDVENVLHDFISEYKKNDVAKEAIDSIQKGWECCGITSFTDWGTEIPKSCCASSECSVVNHYNRGCLEPVYDGLRSGIKIVGIVVITIAAVELAGIAFITVGTIYTLNIESLTVTLDRTGITFSLAPALLLTVGIVIFVISFFGCCGAIKESSCLLVTYAIILLLLFFVQIAIGVYAFVQFKDSNGADEISIEDGLKETMHQYYRNSQAKETFDTLQSQLKCCGVKGPKDWSTVRAEEVVPSSCCDRNPTKCYPSSAYQTGCLKILYKFLHDSVHIIGIIFIIIAVVEYALALIIIFFLQVGTGVYAVQQFPNCDKEKTLQNLQTAFKLTMSKYHTDEESKKSLDYVQNLLLCCGADGPQDYGVNDLPNSCCPKSDECIMDNAFKKGCVLEIYNYIRKKIMILGKVALILSMFEFFGIVISLLLAIVE
ncbi:hypothetical protein FQA39_LY05917 [Lamprigera yunnana]|nr:hypothetical protein FQA39_LY05917 [Lamprigera yunnana]